MCLCLLLICDAGANAGNLLLRGAIGVASAVGAGGMCANSGRRGSWVQSLYAQAQRMQQSDEEGGGREGRGRSVPNITPREWAAYHMHGRDPPYNNNNMHVYGRRLYQEFVADAYCVVEGQRLRWLKFNQSTIRAELYNGLMDHLQAADVLRDGPEERTRVGKHVVLPSSFLGSPRHMLQLYQDSMAIVRARHKLDLFITFTCNPKWPEILQALQEFPNMCASDRMDIVNRVFKMKLHCHTATLPHWQCGSVTLPH